MTNEQLVSDFMQKYYTDEKLAALLAHAEDGKLSFDSCCCFIGMATVDHAPQERGVYYIGEAGEDDHYDRAERLPGAIEAEAAFLDLAGEYEEGREEYLDAACRAALIPLIQAEFERRERERSKSSIPVDTQVVSV